MEKQTKSYLGKLYTDEKDFNEAKSNLFGFLKLLVEIDQEQKNGGAIDSN